LSATRAKLGSPREVIHDLLLFVIHQTGDGDEQQPERIKGS